MIVKKADFVRSAEAPEHYPDTPYPEIAFAGRSNVGKSSLINSLTGRKGLVKVSKTPGKTQLLNFFLINEKMMFVDMPGYGFARVPDSVKETWGAMVERYIQSRTQLKALIVLLDCRRVPNQDDRELLEWLRENEIPALLVFTKIDKTPKTHRHRQIKDAMNAIADIVDVTTTKPFVYSSLSGEGKKALWSVILEVAGHKTPTKD